MKHTKRAGGMRWHAYQTHCKHGHELSGSNVRIRADRNERVCRKCILERAKEYQARKRA